MTKIIPYEELSTTDLHVDAVYEGKSGNKLAGEALSKLLPGIGNLGGFRASGRGKDKKFVVLTTSGENKDWPDSLDLNTGKFVYYGDNRQPGHELHSTPRGGNQILCRVFDLLHGNPSRREQIPPFLVFQKFPTAVSIRSFQFKGLAVPGFAGLPATADLVAVWKTSAGQRFQNYQAIFTLLNVAEVSRKWINDLTSKKFLSEHTPPAWRDWIQYGKYDALAAENTTIVRSLEEQVPDTDIKLTILKTVWEYFKDSPQAFEVFAACLFQMHDPNAIVDEITRGAVDGGRDAVGRYLLGLKDDPIYARYSLEAKCYQPPLHGRNANTVGVKEVSRLISRLRHREFGVLVTTSVIGRQAYKEVRQDQHPIIFICGKDIADILTERGFNTPKLVKAMLKKDFAASTSNVSDLEILNTVAST